MISRWRLESTRERLHGSGLRLIEAAAPGALCLPHRLNVELSKPGLCLGFPLLRPVFAWRYFAMMAGSAHGMAYHLGCRLAAIEE